MKKLILGLSCVAVAILLISLSRDLNAQMDAQIIEDAGSSKNAPTMTQCLIRNGQSYPLKSHLQTVLLIGTDGRDIYRENPDEMQQFYNFNQADFLMVLVLDNAQQSVEIIQLNRDTMTDVPWLDVLGEPGGTNTEQLCLAFNSGSGGADSCKNTKFAVQSLLFDAPIDHYIQISMDSISTLNDLVGGVSVTIHDDLTSVDPVFIQGQTIRLNGAQAEKFIRARMVLEDDTNVARMHRQRDYMEAFQVSAKKAVNTDSAFVMKAMEKLSSHLASDMTANQISTLISNLDAYTVHPIRYCEGELLMGSEYYEFYPDMDSLWEIVKYAYCA